ncbi:MAG: hypothetical protein LJE60_13810 [Thiocapsa sp.]|jgi:hypothetical protein|nr:hypothetical protein [Thiocapsa sp.]MCG6898162.1 hypothetical protein [Thiocapsa sp.]
MDRDKAVFQAMALQAEAARLDRVETMAYFSITGVPLEVITRLDSLWDKTIEVAETTLDIGKIVLLKLIQFIKANPHAGIGLLIGLALGMLINAVPYVGPIIAPVAAVALTVVSTLSGHRLDTALRGDYTGDGLIEDLITITKQFWTLIWDIMNSIIVEPERR